MSVEFINHPPTPALNVQNYIADGFVRVCNVKVLLGRKWKFIDINEDVMFDSHESWVYFIVVGDEIRKVGETSKPLGIKSTVDGQPITGTKCRLGRLRSHADSSKNDTDEDIRWSIGYNDFISVWAKKCELVAKSEMIAGKPTIMTFTSQGAQELEYLSHIATSGYWPALNKCWK